MCPNEASGGRPRENGLYSTVRRVGVLGFRQNRIASIVCMESLKYGTCSSPQAMPRPHYSLIYFAGKGSYDPQSTLHFKSTLGT